MVLQGTWEVFTLVQIIQWNHIDSVWLTILFSHMSFTRRWKFMLVSLYEFVLLKLLTCARRFIVVFVDFCTTSTVWLYMFLFWCIMQRPHKAYPVELAQFHSADYVEFLNRITPDTQHLFSNELAKCMYFLFISFTISLQFLAVCKQRTWDKFWQIFNLYQIILERIALSLRTCLNSAKYMLVEQ